MNPKTQYGTQVIVALSPVSNNPSHLDDVNLCSIAPADFKFLMNSSALQLNRVLVQVCHTNHNYNEEWEKFDDGKWEGKTGFIETVGSLISPVEVIICTFTSKRNGPSHITSQSESIWIHPKYLVPIPLREK